MTPARSIKVTVAKFVHQFENNVQESARVHGLTSPIWRPAVPMPYFVGIGHKKARCGCGDVFPNEEAYRAHFIYHAVWENESGYIPEQIREGIGRAFKQANADLTGKSNFKVWGTTR